MLSSGSQKSLFRSTSTDSKKERFLDHLFLQKKIEKKEIDDDIKYNNPLFKPTTQLKEVFEFSFLPKFHLPLSTNYVVFNFSGLGDSRRSL
jgi:hypothetical protein